MLRGILSTGWSAARMFHVTNLMLSGAQLLHPEPGAVKWVASNPGVLSVVGGDGLALVDPTWCGVTHVVGVGQRSRCVVTIKVVPNVTPTKPPLAYSSGLAGLKCFTGGFLDGQPQFIHPFLGYGVTNSSVPELDNLTITWMKDYVGVGEITLPTSPWNAPTVVNPSYSVSTNTLTGLTSIDVSMPISHTCTFHLLHENDDDTHFQIDSQAAKVLTPLACTFELTRKGWWAVLAIDRWGTWYHSPNNSFVVN